MQQYLKPLRLVVSVAMLIAVGFVFLDFGGSVPSSWYGYITWLQFVPSLLKFQQSIMHGLALTAYGFLAVFILTLLFGRVYCSWICPLGIFQDVLSRFSLKIRNAGKKKFRYRFAPSKSRLRYAILVVVCLSLLTGSIFLVNVLDPYSNFGRFTSDLFRPLYMVGNNLLVKLLESFNTYALYPVTIAKTDPCSLIVPVVMLGLVVWLSVRKGRLYCNAVCPVGTLLGLASKASLFRVRIDAENCNRCGKCMFACKSQCIDIKNREVDFSRCVGCGNCLRSCDRDSIRYSLAPIRKLKPVEATDRSKRRFILGSALFMAALGGFSVNSIAQNRQRNQGKEKSHAKGSGKGTGNKEVVKTHAVTPPGSRAFEHFSGACTACHLCVSSCPTGVLKPSFLEYGFSGMMQPFMDYHANFCNYECVRCTEVCPNGAILPLKVEEKLTVQTGVVRFVKHNCIVFTDETSCGSCSEHCPTKAVRMVPYKGELTIPHVTPEICVGCGACEYACPVTPYKAIIVDGHPEHRVARKPQEEELEEKPLEEFPF